MFHLSDNELDRLSREAAEQYDVEQNTSGWDALERKLDKELPVAEKKRRRRFLMILTSLVLVSGMGLTLLLLRSEPTTSLAGEVHPSKIPSEEKVRTNAEGTVIEPSVSTPNAIEKTRTDNPPAYEAGNEKLTPRAESVAGKNSASDQIQQPTRINQEAGKNSRSNSRYNDRARKTSGVGIASVATQKPAGKDQGKTQNAGRGQNIDNTNEESPVLKTAHVQEVARAQSAPYSVPTPILPVTQSTASVNKKEEKKFNWLKGLEFGILGGPDMSNVHFTAVDDPGFNVGISAQYRFSRKWSVTTGLIYTKKIYTADGDDYHPPKGYWTYNTTLHTVEGDCEMFEIPLAVRYDLSRSKVNRYFVSAGLSSYLMNEETYDYYYTYNGIYMNRGRAYDSDAKYFLSIAHLSAGFEKTINNRFSFQVEPYLKLPLSGVGFGDMRMNSYGIYFSFKYKPFAGSPVPVR